MDLLVEKVILASQLDEAKEVLKNYEARVKEVSVADKTVVAQIRCTSALEEKRDALSDKVMTHFL